MRWRRDCEVGGGGGWAGDGGGCGSAAKGDGGRRWTGAAVVGYGGGVSSA